MKIKKFNQIFNVKKWKGEVLQPFASLDTETELIESPSHIPRLVITTAFDGLNAYIITNKDISNFLETHKDHTLILHNFAFDMNVLTKACGFLFWQMIEQGRIIDTAILYKLVWIATKGFTPHRWSLDVCVSSLLKDVLPKDKSIRLTFGQYIKDDNTIDYKNMSKAHIQYAVLDPIATHLVYLKLMKKIKKLPTTTNLAHTIHLMGDVALNDIQRRGIGVDIEYTENLRRGFSEVLNKEAGTLATWGWTRGKKGNQEAYNKVIDFIGLDLPKTERGYSMESELLLPFKDHPFIASILKYLEVEKKTMFLKELTTDRVHPRYDSIKNTGRTSCSKPNIQNPPRTGGIRECFKAKEGYTFCDVDYGSIEMYTIAYIMKDKGFGSTMFDVLNNGEDPHIFAASIIYNKPAEEIDKSERQAAKIANYGFLANMSEATFVDYASSFGIEFTLEDAKRIKKGWANAYPEVKKFWKSGFKANGMFKSKSGFIRANCVYTSFLNTHFQGMAVEGIKIAMYLCLKAELPMVAMIHDQLMIEVPKEDAEVKLEELQKLMIEGMQMICPMKIKVDGTIRERHGK